MQSWELQFLGKVAEVYMHSIHADSVEGLFRKAIILTSQLPTGMCLSLQRLSNIFLTYFHCAGFAIICTSHHPGVVGMMHDVSGSVLFGHKADSSREDLLGVSDVGLFVLTQG